MRYEAGTHTVTLCEEVRDEPLRPFTDEDLEHLLAAYILLEPDGDGLVSMPGFESVYRQVQLRLEDEGGPG